MSLTDTLILTDIAIKTFIESSVARGEEKEILEGKVIIRKVYNEGVCLNLLEKYPCFVRVVSAFVTVILTIYQLAFLMRKGRFFKKLGLSLMTAGAWSNTFDRLVRHYVVDYFGIKTKWKKITRITFNLGDFFLIGGGAMLIISMLFHRKKS